MPLKFYCKTALTSLSDNVSYITFLFSEWHIEEVIRTILYNVLQCSSYILVKMNNVLRVCKITLKGNSLL